MDYSGLPGLLIKSLIDVPFPYILQFLAGITIDNRKLGNNDVPEVLSDEIPLGGIRTGVDVPTLIENG